MNQYLNNKNFKKAIIGGYDRQDVNDTLKTLLKIHQESLKKERLFYEARLQSMQLEIDKLKETQVFLEQEKEKMKVAYKEYCTNMLQQYSESLRSLSTEFTQIMENISTLQCNLLQENQIIEVEVLAQNEN